MKDEQNEKPDPWAEEGVKDSAEREDASRRDKRPKPLGPSTAGLDRAMAEGTIAPDPNTPKRTPE